MWRQLNLIGSYFAQQSPTRQAMDDSELHTHSPRRIRLQRPYVSTAGSMPPPSVPLFPRTQNYDPFTESGLGTYNRPRQESSGDVSMPDFSGTSSRLSHSRVVTDPMSLDRTLPRFESMQNPGAYEYTCEALLPAAPVNTPQNGEHTPAKAQAGPSYLSTSDTSPSASRCSSIFYCTYDY